MSIRITATRGVEDPRRDQALKNPIRRKYAAEIDPLDHRIESPLGRMLLDKRITEVEYAAGCRWRLTYSKWLRSIHDEEISDEDAEDATKAFKACEKILKALGPRVFHATNAVAVYEETEDLGDFEFTAEAARRGLYALANFFIEDYEIIPAPPIDKVGLLDAPRQSRNILKGKSKSRAARELLPELKAAGERLVLVDCEENSEDGSIEIRRYRIGEGSF